jgi:glucokinase
LDPALYLARDEIVAIGNVMEGVKRGNLAVLGPGTGLGVGALVRAAPVAAGDGPCRDQAPQPFVF